MATCPYCMGALTENHRCRRGRLTRLGDALLTVLVGSSVGALLCWGIEERPTGPLLMATAALGAVLASAVRQALSPGSRL
jgi:hypothetical protein